MHDNGYCIYEQTRRLPSLVGGSFFDICRQGAAFVDAQQADLPSGRCFCRCAAGRFADRALLLLMRSRQICRQGAAFADAQQAEESVAVRLESGAE